MSLLDKKIDFMVVLEVKGANPNGDPLNGNMPREDYSGYGEISDVCIKRKIRNRLQDNGKEIFVKSNDRSDDGFFSLQKRYENIFGTGKEEKKNSDKEISKRACEKWMDVRSFGQVMTFNKRSIGIRGPVSISLAKSVDPIDMRSIQITRSTNGQETEGKKASDTMGTKHFVEYGIYIIKGSINTFFAEKTGFTQEDAADIKEALRTLFVNDVSSARPDGSMVVKKIYWFTHNSKIGDVSSAKIHELINHTLKNDVDIPKKFNDYIIGLNEEYLKEYQEKGVNAEIIEGI